MQSMLDYTIGLLRSISDFLSAEPMIYLVGILFGAVAVRIFQRLLHIYLYM